MRICVLVDSHLQQWQIRVPERLLEETDARLTLLVANAAALDDSTEPEVRSDRGISAVDIRLFGEKIRMTGAWPFVLAEQKFAGLTGDGAYWDRTPIDEVTVLADGPRQQCYPESDGEWNMLPTDVVDRIGTEADVVVRFGFGLLEGRSRRYGIWRS